MLCANYLKVNDTKHAFEKLCPIKFKVLGVECAENNVKPYCTWIVKYIYANPATDILNLTNAAVKQDFKILTGRVPIGLTLIKKSKRYEDQMVYCLEYKVIECEHVAPNFNLKSTQPNGVSVYETDEDNEYNLPSFLISAL